jgi:hypothetical protein
MRNFNFFNFLTNRKSYFLVLSLSILSLSAFAQRVVEVASGTELSAVIVGDTLDNGDPVDANTVYVLERDGLYPVAKELRLNRILHIKAADGAGALPALYAQKDASNNYPKLINTKGDVTLENIYISNANGPEANPKWGGFRVGGTNSRVILRGCHFEFDKASTVQIRADSIKLYMENCVAAKTGNYATYNGNGRLVDTRGYYVDSIVVRNVTAYYMQDRVVRNMGGEINYLEFDHITVVNNQGMHGVFAMAKVHHAKITNNLLINAEYGGDLLNDPEQTGPEPDKLHIYMITMDTVYDDTELEIHHNNFAFTPDLIDFFNGNDTIWKPMVLAPLVATTLGADSANAYFEEVVEFNNMPGIPWDFLEAIYTDPQPSPMPNNWPDEIGIMNVNAGYADTYDSYRAAEDGKPLGDMQWFPNWEGVNAHTANVSSVVIYPNPVTTYATFKYELNKSSNVQLMIYSLTGQLISTVDAGYQLKGSNSIDWTVNTIPAGIYFYSIKSNNSTQTGKIIITK